MRRLVLLASLMFVGTTACHWQQSSGDTGHSLRNVITREQIDSTAYTNVYDVVVRYHADYLNDRGIVSIKTDQHARAVVFLNDQEYGIPETLRNFPTSGVEEIRYFTGTEAVSKFGSQYGGGVIQVISRTQ